MGIATMRIGLMKFRRLDMWTGGGRFSAFKVFAELHYAPDRHWASVVFGPAPACPVGGWLAMFDPEEPIEPPMLSGDIMTATHKGVERPRFVGKVFTELDEWGNFKYYNGTIEMTPTLTVGRSNVLPIYLEA